MTERDTEIVKLTRQGMSANKVKSKLDLGLTVRTIQRIAAKHVGPMSTDAPSWDNQIPNFIRPHVEWCLQELGKNPYHCEICDEPQNKKCDIHHTKYEGATIYDLQYVCRSCNLARVNHGLV